MKEVLTADKTSEDRWVSDRVNRSDSLYSRLALSVIHWHYHLEQQLQRAWRLLDECAQVDAAGFGSLVGQFSIQRWVWSIQACTGRMSYQYPHPTGESRHWREWNGNYRIGSWDELTGNIHFNYTHIGGQAQVNVNHDYGAKSSIRSIPSGKLKLNRFSALSGSRFNEVTTKLVPPLGCPSLVNSLSTRLGKKSFVEKNQCATWLIGACCQPLISVWTTIS